MTPWLVPRASAPGREHSHNLIHTVFGPRRYRSRQLIRASRPCYGSCASYPPAATVCACGPSASHGFVDLSLLYWMRGLVWASRTRADMALYRASRIPPIPIVLAGRPGMATTVPQCSRLVQSCIREDLLSAGFGRDCGERAQLVKVVTGHLRMTMVKIGMRSSSKWNKRRL